MNEQFTNPSQIGPAGASSLRVPSRLSDPRATWGAIAQTAKALDALRGGNQLTDDKINALKRTGFRCLDHPHPFKIYNVPEVLRAVQDPASDWLKFRVRAGYVGTQLVTGTDGITTPYTPDSYDIPLASLADEITADAGVANYYFWIDTTGATPTIKSSSNPASLGWSSYPANDNGHILIGWVDTLTLESQSTAIVRQILRTDIQPAQAAGGTSLFKITDSFATTRDYFTAYQIAADGTFPALTTYISKHPKDRPSVTSVTISGTAVTYGYTDNFNRTTTVSGNSQLEQLFLIPQTNDIVMCSRLSFPDPTINITETGGHPTWVDITPRVWARKKDQS